MQGQHSIILEQGIYIFHVAGISVTSQSKTNFSSFNELEFPLFTLYQHTKQWHTTDI